MSAIRVIIIINHYYSNEPRVKLNGQHAVISLMYYWIGWGKINLSSNASKSNVNKSNRIHQNKFEGEAKETRQQQKKDSHQIKTATLWMYLTKRPGFTANWETSEQLLAAVTCNIYPVLSFATFSQNQFLQLHSTGIYVLLLLTSFQSPNQFIKCSLTWVWVTGLEL